MALEEEEDEEEEEEMGKEKAFPEKVPEDPAEEEGIGLVVF